MSNFARNIGEAFGISALNTFMARQQQTQRMNLPAHTNHGNPFFQSWLNGTIHGLMGQGYNHTTATEKALAQLSGTVSQQAAVVGYVNSFWMMGMIVLLLAPMVFLLRTPSASAEAAAAGAN